MRASAIHDKPVISIAEGERLGSVSDLLLDTGELRVAALELDTAGGRSVVPFGSIKNIGADAITVGSVEAVHGLPGRGPVGNVRVFDQIKGLPVSDSEGTYLGDVAEVELDPYDGTLTRVVVHRGGVFGLGGHDLAIERAAIRAVGEKLITVDRSAAAGQAPAGRGDEPTGRD